MYALRTRRGTASLGRVTEEDNSVCYNGDTFEADDDVVAPPESFLLGGGRGKGGGVSDVSASHMTDIHFLYYYLYHRHPRCSAALLLSLLLSVWTSWNCYARVCVPPHADE